MKVVVHEFSLGDVEDPDIYAAQPIWKWQQTDQGRWVMENALDAPYWCKINDYHTYTQKYKIVAELKDEDATYFCLRWK
jgi:hypothetical protein